MLVKDAQTAVSEARCPPSLVLEEKPMCGWPGDLSRSLSKKRQAGPIIYPSQTLNFPKSCPLKNLILTSPPPLYYSSVRP